MHMYSYILKLKKDMILFQKKYKLNKFDEIISNEYSNKKKKRENADFCENAYRQNHYT